MWSSFSSSTESDGAGGVGARSKGGLGGDGGLDTWARSTEGNFCRSENGSYEQILPIAAAAAATQWAVGCWLPLPRSLEADKTDRAGRGPDADDGQLRLCRLISLWIFSKTMQLETREAQISFRNERSNFRHQRGSLCNAGRRRPRGCRHLERLQARRRLGGPQTANDDVWGEEREEGEGDRASERASECADGADGAERGRKRIGQLKTNKAERPKEMESERTRTFFH